MSSRSSVIGITADVHGDRFRVSRGYADLVSGAGGLPVILPTCRERIADYLALCDGFILTGGDDPDTRQWNIPLHAEAKPIDPVRQAFEWALLDALETDAAPPALGVCLGMQLMGLHAGGSLDQHLLDTVSSAADHWGGKTHTVEGALGHGRVHSHHRQAIRDPGTLDVVATAPDGVIEAVRCPRRRFHLGVQWHPERMPFEPLGEGLIRRLVAASSA